MKETKHCDCHFLPRCLLRRQLLFGLPKAAQPLTPDPRQLIPRFVCLPAVCRPSLKTLPNCLK
ncbi:hypothetical protein E2C01_100021 [Portunus trituberculatus]|uniref:Uncharacterized protein n=1 Tax=Portunus trituberculatus TaxID=210409 RepID=A0A5B7KAY8_PORTR|nr:hypothetical protein [Portunus trituberculatus]